MMDLGVAVTKFGIVLVFFLSVLNPKFRSLTIETIPQCAVYD